MFAEGQASLARSASLDACPLALPVPCVSGLLSGRLKLGFFFAICPFLFSFWTVPLTLVLSCQHVSLEIKKFALCDSERRVGKVGTGISEVCGDGLTDPFSVPICMLRVRDLDACAVKNPSNHDRAVAISA